MIDSAASEAVPLKIYILRPPLIKAFADRDPSLRPPFSSTTAPRHCNDVDNVQKMCHGFIFIRNVLAQYFLIYQPLSFV